MYDTLSAELETLQAGEQRVFELEVQLASLEAELESVLSERDALLDENAQLQAEITALTEAQAQEPEEGIPAVGDSAGASQVIYDQDGIVIVITGVTAIADSIFTEILFSIQNNTEQNFTVQARNVSINDIMIDPIMSTDIVAGKTANTELTFLTADLVENGISELQTLEVSFHIFDSDTWENIVDTEAIVLEFNA
ncbi:MAG TPA: hypothetical protein DEB31_08930 [Clostridiales bacterium]|nr:hypothetical protein [Clostridiales bacterium]